jgi:hypothetical protein
MNRTQLLFVKGVLGGGKCPPNVKLNINGLPTVTIYFVHIATYVITGLVQLMAARYHMGLGTKLAVKHVVCVKNVVNVKRIRSNE